MKGKVACLSDCQWPDALISLFFFLSIREQTKILLLEKTCRESVYGC